MHNKEQMIKLIKENRHLKNKELAELCNCSVSMINILKKKAGVQRQKFTVEDRAKNERKIITALKRGGMTSEQLAKKVGIKVTTMNSYLFRMKRDKTVDNQKDGKRLVWMYVEPTEVRVLQHSIPMSKLAGYVKSKDHTLV